MPRRIKSLVAFTLLSLWGSFVFAAETSDPFGTDALLPPKPALR